MVKCLTLAAVAVMVTESASAATAVQLELALLVDVSGSVDGTEFALQRNGYVAEFQDPAIQAAITTLATQTPGVGGLAVSYIMWSGASQQQLSVGWTLINDATSANAFAASILAASRPYSGQTAIQDAIIYGTDSILNNGIDSARQVIDVSGDGSNNQGAGGNSGQAHAMANGVDKINGLPILGDEAGLLTYYQNNVQAGAGSFTLPASSFGDFEAAVGRKILAEINNTNPVPEGGPGLVISAILFTGLAGLRMKLRSSAKAA